MMSPQPQPWLSEPDRVENAMPVFGDHTKACLLQTLPSTSAPSMQAYQGHCRDGSLAHRLNSTVVGFRDVADKCPQLTLTFSNTAHIHSSTNMSQILHGDLMPGKSICCLSRIQIQLGPLVSCQAQPTACELLHREQSSRQHL